MKKVFALVLALTMLCCSAAFAADTDIAILVPNADHGWTGAVMTYAEEKAAAVNAEGTYTAQVITSADPANQITQVEDIIENQSANTVVILPQDNTLEVTMRRLADSGIPFVMFDRVIDSVSEQAVASVKGDNEGIGAETAKRFIEDGMVPGDKILIIPGDNSSVPQMRNDGFFGVLLENGWTQEQIDAEKKDAFLAAGVHLASSSGLNEFYSVLKGIHQRDYSAEVAGLADLFTVTYDPAMIEDAIDDMIAHLNGEEVPKDHVIAVQVVDATNVNDFVGFGDAVAAE